MQTDNASGGWRDWLERFEMHGKIITEPFVMRYKEGGLLPFFKNHSSVRDFYAVITWNLSELLLF